MSKIAAIMTDLVEDIEITSPKEALENAGNEVVIISDNGKDHVDGKQGSVISIDESIDNVDSSSFDALLIPGGFSPDQLRTDDRYVDFTKNFVESGKPVFAICHGPQIFIQAGVTEGRTMTGFTSVRPDLANAGAHVKDEEVVIDDNLITSRTPDDLEAFNKEIVNALK
ncbi:type 1 glutamine amidotransferase domain-containing protein [Tetragenococcus muriaticus]|uniref:ThiJ/PfpI family protein n=2 Tax=Tetragenococcus muriaticus TaxID=64642 RepID=A0A091C9X4_9ENTE|nr:type 1 glutamine amidotransferase domain-containing protein [Tetragenococcus muriaticus]KFN93167.1 ThiJ/PfpI family protein [Tetragenococcus muriaticus 3MR10-3]KFN93722.1 ThiJ/PfpI family protein [Tetragenococcus muriaticus PMC-11-5]